MEGISIALDGEDENGPEPRDILARIFAHMGHRIPGVKRIEKRLEGQDKRSGIGSDLLAFAAQVYRRNEKALQQIALEGAGQIQANRQARKAAKETPEIVGYVTDSEGAYYAVSREGSGVLVDPATLTPEQRAEAESKVVRNEAE